MADRAGACYTDCVMAEKSLPAWRAAAPFARLKLGLCAALALCACSGATEDRGAVIVQTLVEADRDFIGLRPQLVQEKYRRMAESPQTFLRGAAALFYRDLTARVGTVTARHGAGSEQITLYGDVHVENIGSAVDPQGPLLEATDYDAALRGPFDFDVQRGAVTLAAALHQGQRGDAAVAGAVRAYARAYVFAVASAAAGAPLAALRSGADMGPIADDLLGKAARAVTTREDLSRYTVNDPDQGARLIKRDADTVEPPAPFGERAPLQEALLRYRSTRRGGPLDPAALQIKDVALRLNAGLASLPNLRLWVLCEGPAGPADDLLLELKEERDPPLPSVLLGLGPASPRSGEREAAGPADLGGLSPAARAVATAQVLLSSPGVELDLGHLTLNGVSFLVRAVTRGRRNLDVATMAADLSAGRVKDADVVQLGAAIGRLVGAGHGRTGREAAAAILTAIGDREAFIEDTLARAQAAHQQLRQDLDLFQEALRARGPLLGAQVPR